MSITVKGDSERIHQTLEKISQTTRDNVCTPAEVETFRENGTNSSTLRETGIVEVKIDKGDATVPDDVLQGLQQYALDLFDTMIEERFLVAADAGRAALGFDERPGPAHRRGGEAADQPLQGSRDGQSLDHEPGDQVDRSQVVEWPTGGSATLATFFAGASARGTEAPRRRADRRRLQFARGDGPGARRLRQAVRSRRSKCRRSTRPPTRTASGITRRAASRSTRRDGCREVRPDNHQRPARISTSVTRSSTTTGPRRTTRRGRRRRTGRLNVAVGEPGKAASSKSAARA